MDRKSLRSLEVEVERLGKLVSDLHDLTVSDEGGLSFEAKRINLSELLSQVLEYAKPRLTDARISVETDISGDALFVTGDRDRLQQLFTNLIENTLRYTDGPGQLRVQCGLESETVNIIFADSAPGVPGEALARLFERLYRVDASRSRASGGAGLGLSICKSIVDAHNGTITARSSDLGGIAIAVHLPPARPSGS